MAQVPVLTFDIGAVGDRVKKDNLGWIIDFDTNSSKILEKINDIINNKDEYKKKKSNFKKYKFKTVEEMQKYYENLYAKVENRNEVSNIYNFMNLRRVTKEFDLNELQTAYGHIIHKYEKMRNSKMWKVAKIIKAKIKRK